MTIYYNNISQQQRDPSVFGRFWTWISGGFTGIFNSTPPTSNYYTPQNNVYWQNRCDNFYGGYSGYNNYGNGYGVDPSMYQQPCVPQQPQGPFGTFLDTLRRYPFLAAFLPNSPTQQYPQQQPYCDPYGGYQDGYNGYFPGGFPPGYGFPQMPPINYMQMSANGEVVINGTNQNDNIVFNQDRYGVYVTVNGENKGYLPPNTQKVTVHGLDGDDTIDASAVNLDILNLYGDAGNDTIKGSSGNDLIDGGAGKDQLYGNDGDDEINAAGDEIGNSKSFSENDQIWGGAGADHITTDQFSDRIKDQAGEDLIDNG